jgi:hypothetical protein
MNDAEVDLKWFNVHYENSFMGDNSLFVMQVTAVDRDTAINRAELNLISYVLLPNNWQFIDCQETEL